MQRALQYVILAALLGTMGSVLRCHPRHLAYFNELAGGPCDGYRHMLGSSFDWGQEMSVAIREAALRFPGPKLAILGEFPGYVRDIYPNARIERRYYTDLLADWDEMHQGDLLLLGVETVDVHRMQFHTPDEMDVGLAAHFIPALPVPSAEWPYRIRMLK